MSAALEARLQATLRDIEAAGLQRQLRDLRMQDATRGVLDGQPVTVLCSNDYLGLAQHPEVVAAWQGAGAGSAGAGDSVTWPLSARLSAARFASRSI